MRIRTAAAAAALASAALLGSAGSAFADHNEAAIAKDNDGNKVKIGKMVHKNSHKEWTLSKKHWNATNISGNYGGGARVGDLERGFKH
ncbi:hypothetical protein [Streptomyces iconiensis]|uniref:Uncharacterized protein n=1 Tax=Streptomyces iconiensis TaxID=1384038 RepID=A0ABT7ABK6_9ACTN|nr:hypothetical protein [Streptomyces iconiensis]MDJ1138384.1 hypothetical protein [Streptomyces iconiensis]